MKQCSQCAATKPLLEFYRHPKMVLGVQSRCKQCTKAAALKDYRADPSYVIRKARERKIGMPLRTPEWANRAAMADTYRTARRLSGETGIPHQVDHIVPIRSPLVCGLHSHTNLQVLPASINAAKGNRLWPDMP